MATIRALSEADVPAVAALFRRVSPAQSWASQAACESYFREVLLDNPWRDPELPSWLAEEEGHVIGFQAVLPRPMLLRGRALRVAVGCQFMVDPDKRHGLTALQLGKAFLSGPQDLSLADGANEPVRRMWVGLGGTTSLLYSLHWTRLLRPARYVFSRLERRNPSVIARLARPLAAPVDAIFARLRPNRFPSGETELTEEPLDPEVMLAHLPGVMAGRALQPAYDSPGLAWLLDEAARKTRHGNLRARVVLDRERRPIGWYLYYVEAHGVGEVLQLAARDDCFDSVLQRLLADAWRNRAVAVRGRLDPRYIQELSDRHCWLRREGTWTLVHSRHDDVKAAILQGDAFLSRLEGEWWLRFHGG
jgi:hypothetical protein